MLTVRLKNRSPIVVKLKPYAPPIEAHYQHLLKIYQQGKQQGKEDYQNGKTNNK